MTILSPLKPLLCRHDYVWSERDHAERCRNCGKLRAGERVEAAPTRPAGDLPPLAEPAPFSLGPVDFLDIPELPEPAPVPFARKVSAKVLKAQALTRRDNLLALLERLSHGRQPSREEAIDAVLAVIEDAHSADPVLFGAGAAAQFAKLHEARDGFIF